ncbi:TPA: hypothetical protein I8Y22_003882 [Raoultella planticola]|nr:hypothetical protein [Raoultella planticola]
MHGDEILQNAAITRIIQHFAAKEIFLHHIGSGTSDAAGRGEARFFLGAGLQNGNSGLLLSLLITMKEIKTCVQICTITLVSTQKRKNERLLLACRLAGIHSGGGSFSGLDIFL